MTARQFASALKRLGWSRQDAAKLLGVADRSRVGQWCRGVRPVPPYVAAHVRYRLEVLRGQN